MDRGDRQERIFHSEDDCLLFLRTLGEACGRTGWRVHSYALMGNHYHLLLETPEANLCAGMRWLQGVYTIRHNARHRLRGHLFQGRYKAVLVDGEDEMYFRTVSDYIHLNPVRAGMLGEEQMLADYRWSSFPFLIGDPRKRPVCLHAEWVLEQWGEKDNARGRRGYREAMERYATSERKGGDTSDEGMLKALRRGWCFGSEEFRQRMLEMVGGEVKKPVREIRVAHNEQEAESLIAVGLKAVGLCAEDLAKIPKGDPRKIAIATVVKQRTIVGNEWIARHLQMGAPGRVSRYCSEAGERPEVERLVRRIKNVKK
jgi:putative transposase